MFHIWGPVRDLHELNLPQSLFTKHVVTLIGCKLRFKMPDMTALEMAHYEQRKALVTQCSQRGPQSCVINVQDSQLREQPVNDPTQLVSAVLIQNSGLSTSR